VRKKKRRIDTENHGEDAEGHRVKTLSPESYSDGEHKTINDKREKINT
jgi:hypothetical protein